MSGDSGDNSDGNSDGNGVGKGSGTTMALMVEFVITVKMMWVAVMVLV